MHVAAYKYDHFLMRFVYKLVLYCRFIISWMYFILGFYLTIILILCCKQQTVCILCQTSPLYPTQKKGEKRGKKKFLVHFVVTLGTFISCILLSTLDSSSFSCTELWGSSLSTEKEIAAPDLLVNIFLLAVMLVIVPLPPFSHSRKIALAGQFI